jgi:hypothetical protein
MGRFLTPDPYDGSADSNHPVSWNRYAYVEDDPVNFIDPEGLVRCSEIRVLGSNQTISDLLNSGTDLGLVATTVFVESAMRTNDNGRAEMAAIAAVIVNRFNIVNGFVHMIRSDGTVQQAPAAWGNPDGTMRSIVVNPSQFEVWQGPGGTLTAAAQSRLAAGLAADADSELCMALLNAIGTANLNLAYKRRHVALVHEGTGLTFTGFNSFPYVQKYDWEQPIGQFGSPNRFYGVPDPIPVTRGRSIVRSDNPRQDESAIPRDPRRGGR